MQAELLKTQYPRKRAQQAAEEICSALRTVTERLAIAGSLRREKPLVGDVEILYIPSFESKKPGLLWEFVNVAEEAIEELVAKEVLEKRNLAKDRTSWGPYNKLAVHKRSGIPVDLFRATNENWWNYLVCRTGPASSNMRIATCAIKRDWKWNPYGAGFSQRQDGKIVVHKVESEEAVFDFVGLPYLPPARR